MTQGQIKPCWDPTRAGKAISLKAKVDEKQIDYFLACHSPITHIRDAKTGNDLDEEDLFAAVFLRSRQRDLEAVVYGEPGTGKSHLVHWLKLRADDALSRGELTKGVSILIERGSGSLKHALEQLITQLASKCGDAYQTYLEPVQQAFDRISDATARQKLVLEMATELGPRWLDRGRPELPRLLRPLSEACRAEGFGKEWLCRDDGVIARRIALLTHSSTIEDRESKPRFDDRELQIPERFLNTKKNSDQVIELAHELADSASLREKAVDYLNQAIDVALVELTGLSGANLRRVFDKIRTDLQQHNQRLLVFVEDVSSMAELDMEVINALEPQDRLDLCPMTAVLGMTDEGYKRLRDNQRARFQVQVQVGDQAARQWSEDPQQVAEFAARYLNALRLPEEAVRKVAKQRRETGNDVAISFCTTCPVKEDCHARFGKVTLNGTDVGTYPFSGVAPHRLLQRLDTTKGTGIARNQRGFLMHILSPIVEDPTTLERNTFPPTQLLSLRLPGDPVYWTDFQQHYCGGWSDDEKRRLRDLAQLWITDASSAAEAADSLTPFLEPLGFRSFSKTTGKAPTTKKAAPTPTPRLTADIAKKHKSDERLATLLEDLSNWLERGERLRSAGDWRKWIADLLKKSIPWEDYQRELPLAEVERLIGSGYQFVFIDDQGVTPTNPPVSLRLFPRNKDTRDLLEALARFEEEGGRSWSFEGAELHKRRVSLWLRRNANRVVNELRPAAPCEPAIAVRTATQFLCMAALVRRRSRLPQINAELLHELFVPFETLPAVVFSPSLKKLFEDMKERWDDVRDCVAREIGIRQGWRGEPNFISPEIIQASAQEFRKSVTIEPLADEYGKGFWKSRFAPLLGWKEYGELSKALERERLEMTAKYNEIERFLAEQDMVGDDVAKQWADFCSELETLRSQISAGKVFVHSPEFAAVVKSGVFTKKVAEWGRILRQTQEIVAGDDPTDVLTFDPLPLLEILSVVHVTRSYLDQLKQELNDQEQEFADEGDPMLLHAELLRALEAVSTLMVGKDEGNVEAD